MAFVSLLVRRGEFATATQLIVNTDYIVRIRKEGSPESKWADGAVITMDKSAYPHELDLYVGGTQVDHLLNVLMPE